MFGTAAACDLGYISEVTGLAPFEPPAFYRDWWIATERCSGRTAPFERVTWYVASGISGDGRVGRGRWSEPHEIIIVVGYEGNEDVVRHEMLHDLLAGDRSHSRAEWDRCNLRSE